ncbi:FAD-dependent oxidoreductase [Candidatus Babeliales bacterium]|nr:FAD-dependent oxidoreductase [Candidatus Babeliales bacterium]
MQRLNKIVLFLFVLISIVIGFRLMKTKAQRQSRTLSKNLSYDLGYALRQDNVVPVTIVGSGPAGLSAALYIARIGMKVLTFTGPVPRGQLTQTTYIDNWPGTESVLGVNLMNDMQKHAEHFGATIVNDTITKIDFSTWPFEVQTDEGYSFKTMALIVATGATPKVLGIPGESEYWGKGVTTCAICDAFFFRNKEVVIAGGGDSAAEMVFELIPYVKKVTLLVRKGSMKASQSSQQKILSYPNAAIEYYKEIKEIYGNGQTVTAIDVYDNKTKSVQRRPIDGVFLAIGHDPNNKLVQADLAVDEHGYLLMQGRSQETSIRGVFAAGEIQDPYYRQAIVAAGEGVRAALDVKEFLYEIGFSPELGVQLQKHFFQDFSNDSMQLQEIVTTQELEKYVLKAKGLVVLDVYADDCPGCMKMLPVLEAVASKLKDSVTVLKTNMTKISKTIHPKLWYEPYNVQIRRIPAMVIFKDGKVLDMTTKLFSKRELIEYLQKFL